MRWTILILILLAGQAVTANAQEKADEIASALTEARGLLNAGKPLEAIERLKVLRETKDIRVVELTGVAHYHANQHLKAIELLSPIVDQLPADSTERRESVQVLGLAHYLAGHIPQAIPFLEQTRVWASNNSELAYVLGMAYIQTREPARARESFGRMFRVAPDSAAAHLMTAQMMIRLEFEEFAEAELKQAIEKNPNLPQAHYLLGQLAIYRARFDEGIEMMQKEIALNPGNAMAYYKLGDAYTRQLRWDEAITQLQKSVWINPYYSGPYILLGKAYLKKNNLATAEGMLKRALQFDPNNKSAHYILAQVYQQAGRADEARREFDIAEKLQGNLDKPDR